MVAVVTVTVVQVSVDVLAVVEIVIHQTVLQVLEEIALLDQKDRFALKKYQYNDLINVKGPS